MLVMVWDEKTSFTSDVLTREEGMMGTHDEETKNFFEGSGVEVRHMCINVQTRIERGFYQ